MTTASAAFAPDWGRLGERVEDVGNLVGAAPLLVGVGEDLTDRGPEPQRPVADREHRRLHPAGAYNHGAGRPTAGSTPGPQKVP